MEYTETSLCQLNGGCMGCCGHSFGSKQEVKEAIRKNTAEFLLIEPQNDADLIRFRDRALAMDLRAGVCRNLIEKEGQFFCPLHPRQNSGRELREGHCDITHLCKTAKEFAGWDNEMQKDFLDFIRRRHLDNLDYSLKIDRGELLEKFKSLQKVKTE